VGGKRWQVDIVEPLWDAHKVGKTFPRLIEPFCGGASITYGIRPQFAVLNDANAHLINFYQHLRQGLVFDEVDRLLFINTEHNYYDWRTWHNDHRQEVLEDDPTVWCNTAYASPNTLLHAKVFYFLNQTGRCGMWRENAAGEFNVPYGQRGWTYLHTDFHAYPSMLKGWAILNRPYDRVHPNFDDFVYADPPYDSEFTGYVPGGFTWADQIACANWLSILPCPVVATNQDTPRIRELYSDLGFTIDTAVRTVRLRSKAGEGGDAEEVVMTRNTPSPANSLF
tara:strand:+ start:108 stop:950 length:843 start_codon:yes stop_codon:yes gene_type:complete